MKMGNSVGGVGALNGASSAMLPAWRPAAGVPRIGGMFVPNPAGVAMTSPVAYVRPAAQAQEASMGTTLVQLLVLAAVGYGAYSYGQSRR